MATTKSVKARASKRVARESAPPTREVILDTAERLFAVRGVDGVALRDLAHEMGLTAPSLYNHFPSKQALYEAVLERGLQPILLAVAESWHPGALRPEQMRATVDKMITHLSTHPHLARLLQRALLEESGSVQKLIARWITPLYREGLAVSSLQRWRQRLGKSASALILSSVRTASPWNWRSSHVSSPKARRVIAMLLPM